jgi:hypothetical protein
MATSVDAASGYAYEALQPEKRQIRLVTLVAGTEAIITAKLSTVSLDDEPRFEALSYVWGDKNLTLPIALEGHPFQVTENLEAALHALRCPDVDRVIWIDSICVNQNDVLERNSQILLMRHIFSTCTKCNVWLGKEDEHTRLGIEFLWWLGEDKHIWEWKDFENLTQGSSILNQGPDRNTFINYLRNNQHILLPFEKLMNRSWWTRTWTVQELTLPHTVEFLCGQFIIDWSLFERFFDAISWHYFTTGSCCDPYYRDILNKLNLFVFNETWNRLRALLELRDARGSYAGVRPLGVLELLHEFSYRRATDLRDKVYGVLGLFSTHEITPDYSLGIPAAYIQPSVYDIQQTGSLRAFSYLSQQDPSLGLPSWVPDWSYTLEFIPFSNYQWRSRIYDLYNACGTTIAYPRIFSNTIFSIRGVRLGIVSGSTGEVAPNSEFDDVLAVKDWIAKATASFELPPSPEAIVRLLIQDVRDAVTRADPEAYKDCGAFIDAVVGGEEVDNLDPQVCVTMTAARVERDIFTTEEEYLGNGPKGMQTGDEVWILNGGRMPLILRPSKESRAILGLNLEATPCLTLVGDCYVDGIMDGEAAGALETDAMDIFII